MELKICHLYPDVMNLSGDRGNVTILEKRLSWRGIEVSVTGNSIADPLRASDYDLFFIGNGQPFEQQLLLDDLKEKKAEIISAVEDGIPVLAICGGYQLLGNVYVSGDGSAIEGVGALNVETKCEGSRLVGDYVFSCSEPEMQVIGFENHAGKTWLGEGVEPLGKTVQGHGNNGTDGSEGARYRNVFATYAHGCLLSKNPQLCDHILKIALDRKYGAAELASLEDVFEASAREYMLQRLTK